MVLSAAAMAAVSPENVLLKKTPSFKVFMYSLLPTMQEIGRPLPIALP